MQSSTCTTIMTMSVSEKMWYRHGSLAFGEILSFLSPWKKLLTEYPPVVGGLLETVQGPFQLCGLSLQIWDGEIIWELDPYVFFDLCV